MIHILKHVFFKSLFYPIDAVLQASLLVVNAVAKSHSYKFSFSCIKFKNYGNLAILSFTEKGIGTC